MIFQTKEPPVAQPKAFCVALVASGAQPKAYSARAVGSRMVVE